jgi:MFS family permease
MSGLKKHTSLHALASTEHSRLFITVFAQSFATSLIGIFVPIYLYMSAGFSLNQIILLYIIHYGACLPLANIGMLINHRFGIKRSIAFGLFLQLVGYYLLSFVHGFGFVAFASTLFLAAGGTIYHLGYHIELTRSLTPHKEGKGLSALYMAALGANLLGPMIGGLFITGASFNVLIAVVASILLIGLLPLFRSGDYRIQNVEYNPFRIMQYGEPRQALIFMSQGPMKLAQDIFWPLFIFAIFNNALGLGAVVSAGSVFVMIATYYLGKYIDRHSLRSLRVGVFTHVVSWMLKVLVISPIGVLFTNIFSSMSHSLIDNSFNKIVYGGARDARSQSSYFLYREYLILIGRLIVLSVLYFVTNLPLFFIFIALLGMTMLLAVGDATRLEQSKA